jgi:hypothetical protein
MGIANTKSTPEGRLEVSRALGYKIIPLAKPEVKHETTEETKEK